MLLLPATLLCNDWTEMCHMRAQALERIKATPGFAARACAAHEEYQAQGQDAEEAVHAFCEAHGQAERLSWRHRPDVKTVSASRPFELLVPPPSLGQVVDGETRSDKRRSLGCSDSSEGFASGPAVQPQAVMGPDACRATLSCVRLLCAAAQCDERRWHRVGGGYPERQDHITAHGVGCLSAPHRGAPFWRASIKALVTCRV